MVLSPPHLRMTVPVNPPAQLKRLLLDLLTRAIPAQYLTPVAVNKLTRRGARCYFSSMSRVTELRGSAAGRLLILGLALASLVVYWTAQAATPGEAVVGRVDRRAAGGSLSHPTHRRRDFETTLRQINSDCATHRTAPFLAVHLATALWHIAMPVVVAFHRINTG